MSQSAGIIRLLDNLGRIVIPKELRTTMRLEAGTPIEIVGQGDNILLRNYRPDPLEIENEELRRRLDEINCLAASFGGKKPFDQQETLDRLQEIKELSFWEADNATRN